MSKLSILDLECMIGKYSNTYACMSACISTYSFIAGNDVTARKSYSRQIHLIHKLATLMVVGVKTHTNATTLANTGQDVVT